MVSLLTTGVRRRQSLESLCEAASGVDLSAYESDSVAAIDPAKLFVCPTVTPLYYTKMYDDFTDEQRLRYNQLCGLSFNELAVLFESEFAQRALLAVEHEARRVGDEELHRCVRQFSIEEQHHTDAWNQLNRRSDRWRYEHNAFAITRPSPLGLKAICYVASRPLRFRAFFWLMLALEEKALSTARCSLHLPHDELEPTYREMYLRHSHDEARHVQIDWHLIERYYATLSLSQRQRAAWQVAKLLGGVFLRPARAAVRVVDCLLEEFPELQPRRREIKRQLAALAVDERYHEMMYSRRSTPILFALFDQFPEMRRMESVLMCYRAVSPESNDTYHE